MPERLRIPAEWEQHTSCWLAFPYRKEEWPLNLHDAQHSFAALSRSIAEVGNETVQLLVKDDEVEARARSLIGDLRNVRYITADYGDCWLRDTVPLLGHTETGQLGGLCFQFNGWGGKYRIPFDASVGRWLTDRLGARRFECSIVLEGGALEPNGRGTFLTTASCTLNPNRNPRLTREAFEEALGELAWADRVIWLERGLEHDHTDGHVDMIARFAAPDTVVCMAAAPRDPKAQLLRSIEHQLRMAGLCVVTLPAPRMIAGPGGCPLPASYCNFYIANEAVIVPIYGVPEDEDALKELADAFSQREVIGLPARDLLWGGGAFHCVTQAQPAAP